MGKKYNILLMILIAFLPYYLFLRPGKNLHKSESNPLALAGRKVYENSGCGGCHTRFIKLIPEELVRYFPGSYFKVNPVSLKNRIFIERIDHSGSRLGPDLENVAFSVYGEDFIRGYIADPKMYNPHSVMPSYSNLFKEKLRNDEIVFASGSLKNKTGYLMYNRGEALLYYLKTSSAKLGGNL